jgi:glutamate-5-semialdehyde dehydrogenase
MTIQESMQQIGQQARKASHAMLRATDKQKAMALEAMAHALDAQRGSLQAANNIDLEAGRAKQLAAPLLDRLTLSDRSIDTMIAGLRQIAHMADPVCRLPKCGCRWALLGLFMSHGQTSPLTQLRFV